MDILDAQIHPPHAQLTATGTPLFAEVSDGEAVQLSQAAMQAVGVSAAILVPAGIGGHAGIGICSEYTRSAPSQFAAVPLPDPEDPELESQIDAAAADPSMVGVRAMLAWPPNGEGIQRFHDGVFDRMFTAAQRGGLAMFLFVLEELPVVIDIAERYPDLQIVVDHLGLAQRPYYTLAEDPWAELPQLLALARYENVAVKLGGVPAMSLAPFPYDDVWPHLHRIVDAFGVERCMWASDYTRVASDHTYGDGLALFLHTDQLSETEKAAVLGDSARAVLGWPAPA